MPATTRRGGRTVGSIVGAIVALVALLLGVTAPAYAAPPTTSVQKYVALGDSYAAGQGAGAPMDSCLRSDAAYPVLLDAEPRTNLLRTAACSGATIEVVATTQLSQVNRGTTLVTLTVGANDVGAGAVYAICAPDPTTDACAAAIASVQQLLSSGVIAENLGGLIGAIAERSPNAHIVVTDYPIPFVPGWSPATDAVNVATIGLNDNIEGAVQAAAFGGLSVELASVELAFLGHQAGDTDPWLGANPGIELTFLHPTSMGQAVYRSAIVAALAS
jgi:lysophospholipase L1-like esterase